MATVLKQTRPVPFYWLIVGFACMILSPMLSIMVSAHINERTIAQNEAAKEQARIESKNRYCRLLGSQVEVYRDAQTPVAKEAFQVWYREYREQECAPPR